MTVAFFRLKNNNTNSARTDTCVPGWPFELQRLRPEKMKPNKRKRSVGRNPTFGIKRV
jgi:hypothetical protein